MEQKKLYYVAMEPPETIETYFYLIEKNSDIFNEYIFVGVVGFCIFFITFFFVR